MQRVSDAVAILNHGSLVAMAPIEELLEGGSKGVVYTVTLRGNTDEAQARVSSQPWVTGVKVVAKNGYSHWQVSVKDEAAAESQLLPIIFNDGQISVREFGRKQYDLEEVFLNLTEENSHVH